jgi:hypothetical protein
MTTRRTWLTTSLSLAAGLLCGCAQQGPFLAYRTNVSSLKTSVSHLEYENEQLRKQVAELDSRNREIGDRLVQEEAARDDLASRLDDARNELRRRGLLGDSGLSPGPETDEATPQRTLPAGRSNRKKRKAPFARIPGRIETLPPGDLPDDSSGEDDGASGGREREEFGPQSRLESDSRWLPVARVPGNEPVHTR